ncbi:hypothetical protein [Streptomyces sp. A5-4]|uniref:hypothetical protein n=1 Tax=Streptomyces sp. A5-4 TaxID=3384771 RepID=UPI003DA8EF28
MSFGQGGPSWGGPGGQRPDPYAAERPDAYTSRTTDDTPDWAALADASAARARRRRWMYIGGGVLATAVVGAIVATAVVSAGNGSTDNSNSASSLPSPETLPTESAEPGPSFSSQAPPPPPNPKDFISSAKKDKAPLGADTLFPGEKLTMANNRVYAQGATNRTTSCAAATQGALGPVLAGNGCDQVIRATYSRDGVAVTVGVAVFDTEAQAQKAKQQANGGLASLPGSGVPTFCRGGSVCRKTTNAYGRYAYFTVGGFTNGKNVTKADKDVFTTGDDVAEFTFRQIHRRGTAQASAAATAPAGQ